MEKGRGVWFPAAVTLCSILILSAVSAIAEAQQSDQTQDQSPAVQPIQIERNTGQTESEDGATTITVYDAEFFAPYNPIYVEDMLNRVPGTEGLVGGFGNEDEERRGLRANTDQILINGKRLTGKENASGQFLGALPAKSVERIEIITGNVRELDADVGARVINVILKDDAGTGSGTYSVGVVYNWEGQKRPVPRMSYSGTSGGLSYSLSLQIRPAIAPFFVTDTITNEAGGTLRLIDESRKRDSEQYTARTTVSYGWEGGQTLQLNGYVFYVPRDNTDTTLTFEPITLGNIANGLREVRGIAEDINGRDLTYEIGADYTQPLWKDAKFTGLFIRSTTDVQQDTNNFFRFPNTDLDPLGGDIKDEKATETILRGTVDWALTDKHSLELGVEGAINTLNKDLDFFVLDDGERIDVPVFNSDQKITEDRVEVFSTHSWKPVPALEIQTGLAAEFSWLTQTGSDVGEERSFQFAKPSLDIWYNTDESTQIWFSFLRDVGQLDFDDFVATVNREDDEVLAGNPELAPEKSWDFEIGAERRFAESGGVLNGRVFYRRINDVKDLIPFGQADSQPGNLGSGNHYGFELDSSLRLKRFTGLDAVLSTTYLWQDSEVTDPFTGNRRRIGNQPKYELTVAGRYDIQAWGLSFNFNWIKKGPTIESDFNEFDFKTSGHDLRMFMEKSFGNGYIFRVFTGNILNALTTRTRTRFLTTQAAGTIQQLEFRRQRQTRFTGVSVRGTF